MADWAASLQAINPILVDIQGKTAVIETDFGSLEADIRWINATIMGVFGHKMRVSTTIGTIDVDMDQIDTDYIQWAVEPKGTDPAMYFGMAVLMMSIVAAGALTVGELIPSSRTSRQDAPCLARSMGHSDVGKSRSRKLRVK
jgi:hypothetical protein